MRHEMSLRGKAAFGLSIAESFLSYGAAIRADDLSFSKDGIELAWRWVEGETIDPFQLCEYIDGEINLPFRSTLYASGSMGSDAMAAAFLSIGITAAYACQEANKAPSESVENFGSNEWSVLNNLVDLLPVEVVERLTRIRGQLDDLAKEGQGEFGAKILRSDIGCGE